MRQKKSAVLPWNILIDTVLPSDKLTRGSDGLLHFFSDFFESGVVCRSSLQNFGKTQSRRLKFCGYFQLFTYFPVPDKCLSGKLSFSSFAKPSVSCKRNEYVVCQNDKESYPGNISEGVGKNVSAVVCPYYGNGKHIRKNFRRVPDNADYKTFPEYVVEYFSVRPDFFVFLSGAQKLQYPHKQFQLGKHRLLSKNNQIRS